MPAEVKAAVDCHWFGGVRMIHEECNHQLKNYRDGNQRM
jgi:hypothetical protein